MKKLKVLQFPLANSKGGMAQFELRLWKYIDKERFQFDFASVSKHIDFEDEIRATGARIFYISCYAEEAPDQFAAEFRQILDEGYDIVHLHTSFWKGILAEKVCMQKKVPKVIIHSHSTSVFGTKDLDALLQLHERNKRQVNHSLATDFWACSKPAAEWLFGNQISRNEIVIVHNGIEVENYRFDLEARKALREQYHVADKIVLGCIANFIYQKNHHFLVKLMKELDERYVLLLIGNGKLLDDIKTDVKLQNLDDCILFLGYVNDAWRFYSAMDCFVFPSLAEAFPYACVEAQTNGLPCLVSKYVPDEVDFTPNIYHLELQPKEWMQALSHVGIRTNTRDYADDAVRHHLDIASTVRQVQSLYLR